MLEHVNTRGSCEAADFHVYIRTAATWMMLSPGPVNCQVVVFTLVDTLVMCSRQSMFATDDVTIMHWRVHAQRRYLLTPELHDPLTSQEQIATPTEVSYYH